MKGPIGLTIDLIRKAMDKGGDKQESQAAPSPPPPPGSTAATPAAAAATTTPQPGEPAAPAAPATAAEPRRAAPAPDVDGGFKGPIGYTVDFIKGQLGKGKGGVQAPVDEEGYGKEGAPAQAGVPRDPVHAASKRRALSALMIIGFGLAIDFSMSLMSIQPLYYVLSGPQSAYGLTFGSYDLTAMLCAPLFGLWTDHTRTFRVQVILGAIVNAAGNLLYGFVVLANAWWLMLVARAIAGVGAATLGIGSSYITQTTTTERRQIVLGRYRITQNVARMVGPFVGYLFIGLPNVNSGSSTALKIFNWYTIPGWAAFALVSVLLGVFVWWFVDPTDENEHLVHPDAAANRTPTPERIARFRSFAVGWLFVSFLAIFSFSAFTSNLFALFSGQFHAVTNQGENWKTYLGVGVGAYVGAVVFRRMIAWVPEWWEERKLCVFSNVLLLATWLLVIPYGGSTSVPSQVLYFAATGLTGFAVVINQASLETVFSKKVTQYADVVGPHVGKLMGAYFMAASGGRFAGPLVIGAVTRIATPDGQTNYCTDWVTEPDGSLGCAGPAYEQCAITGDEYYVQGCVLYNAIPMYAAMAGLHVFIGVVMALLLWRNWDYGNAGAPAAEPATPTEGKGSELGKAEEPAAPQGTAA